MDTPMQASLDVGLGRQIMSGLAVLMLSLLSCAAALAQSGPYSGRDDALKGLDSGDAAQRAEAVTWIANNGKPADDELLRQRLSDENPVVRGLAEQGLWLLWSRSGDKAIDALMAKGMEEMQARQLKASIATFTEVIRRKPAFAEGWNRRATALFLAGELRKSLADCDEVMKRNPRHFGALAGYGQIYFQLEQYEKAIVFWKRALEVNPNMGGVEVNIKATEQLIAERRKRSA
jgi:tetratricopeptide (TPR) repeat protein